MWSSIGEVRLSITPSNVAVITLDEDALARRRMLLSQVGLASKIDSYPRQLSGGQQQRVAIARALEMATRCCCLTSPEVLWILKLVGEVLAVMHDLAQKRMTMVAVTHEVSFARDAASELYLWRTAQCWKTGWTMKCCIDLHIPRRSRSWADCYD